MKGHHRNFHFEISDPPPVRERPLKPGGISHLLLEASWRRMINEKAVRNFVLNEIHYDMFPLAAIFGTPYIPLPLYGSPPDGLPICRISHSEESSILIKNSWKPGISCFFLPNQGFKRILEVSEISLWFHACNWSCEIVTFASKSTTPRWTPHL